MTIRTGILCIPEWDEGAITQLRLLLREHLPSAVVMEETNAQSQRNWIEEILRRWADEDELSLILTVGGTYPAPGPSTGEIVPEATLAVVERLLPSLPETMRACASEQTDLALLDRGVAGIRSRSVVINLPAGAAAAHLFFESIAALIPAILAHLNSESNAPRIDDELEISMGEGENLGKLEKSWAEKTEDGKDEAAEINQKAEPAPVEKKGLDPAEFAEFLRRQKRD